MKANKAIATYCQLRTQPFWRLLAADNGPIIIGLLQTHLYDTERCLPASVLYDRVTRDLEDLRARGENLPQNTPTYIANWLAEGYLIRRYPAGVTEEEYELTTATIEVIRHLANLIRPHSAATETRLAMVINALTRLADDTDADKFRRIDRLLAEQSRFDKEIAAIHQGQLRVLSQTTALERAHEIIILADELINDFRRVRDQFISLNNGLRERILENDGNRSVVLASLFAGIDSIAESEAGRTFAAFWRFLTDPEQVATLEQAIDSIMLREFTTQLTGQERRFLRKLLHNLLEQGGMVHEVLQTFAHSLKSFVQSHEYKTQRQINLLLKAAQRAAINIKEEIKATETLAYTLTLTSSRCQSLAQLQLYDPTLQAIPESMVVGNSLTIDLELVSTLVSGSEIDFRALKANISTLLNQLDQASISQVLQQFPAKQGLGSVIGLLALGSRHGYKTTEHEFIVWTGEDAKQRSARIPKIFFLRDNVYDWV